MKIENRREEFGKKNFTTTVFVSARSNEKKFNDASFLGEKQSSRSNNNNKKNLHTSTRHTHTQLFSNFFSLRRFRFRRRRSRRRCVFFSLFLLFFSFCKMCSCSMSEHRARFFFENFCGVIVASRV